MHVVRGLGAALAVTALLAACGSPSSASGGTPTASGASQTNGTSSATASLASLYQKAKQEGQVVWVVGASVSTFQPVVQAFEKKYPGITPKLLTIPTPEIAAKIITEEAAGQVSMDLANGRFDTMGPLLSKGLVVPITNAMQLGVSSSHVLLNGDLLRDYDFVNGWEYNTNLVKTAQLPHSWTSLLAPMWSAGKIVLTAQGSLGGAEANVLTGKWTMSQYESYVKKLKAQKPQVDANGPTALNTIASGRAELGAVPLVLLAQQHQQGAPVGVAPVGTVISLASGTFIPKGAKDPAAAELLSLFLASQGAASAWNQMGYGLSTPCSASYVAQQLCNAHVKVLQDTLSLNSKLTQLEKINNQLISAP